jgi:hypothetical protein
MPRSGTPPIVATIAIALLLVGIGPNWWFTAELKLERDGSFRGMFEELRKFEMNFGLTEVEACVGSMCAEQSLSQAVMDTPFGGLRDDDDPDPERAAARLKRYLWAGRLTFWSGLLAVIALGAGVLVWLTRQQIPVSPGAIGAGLAASTAVAGTIALAIGPVSSMPTPLGDFDVSMGVGYPITLVACGVAAAAGWMLRKAQREAPAPAGATIAVPQRPVPCLRCGGAASYVPQYQRYYCTHCRTYL